MWTHISLIGVNTFAITYCIVICNVRRNKVKIYWWFWAHKAPFLLFYLIANSSFGSAVCHASEARNMGPCCRMYVYVSAHYHTQSWYHHRVLWMRRRVSHGVPEGWPRGCSPLRRPQRALLAFICAFCSPLRRPWHALLWRPCALSTHCWGKFTMAMVNMCLTYSG